MHAPSAPHRRSTSHGRPVSHRRSASYGHPESHGRSVRHGRSGLPLDQEDLVPLLTGAVEGNLDGATIEWSDKAAVCVVVASGGYPEAYEKGKVIDGIGEAEEIGDVTVFHAGTRRGEGGIYTSGGRVLGVTALDEDLGRAADRAYRAVKLIKFEKMYFRNDIGRL